MHTFVRPGVSHWSKRGLSSPYFHACMCIMYVYMCRGIFLPQLSCIFIGVRERFELPSPYFCVCIINPRRACARVTVVVLCVCVCVCVCVSFCYRSSGYSIRLYLQPATPMGFSWALLHFKCVEFRKTLPFKSYGVKKPICK